MDEWVAPTHNPGDSREQVILSPFKNDQILSNWKVLRLTTAKFVRLGNHLIIRSFEMV